MNKKIVLVALNFGAAISLFAETSAFEAGNIDNANPYGLTDSEKAILNNKRSVQSIEANIGSVQEQLEGIRSLMESFGLRMNKLEQRVNHIQERVNTDINSSGVTLTSLKNEIDQAKDIQEKNYKNITATLKQLGSLIDKKITTQTKQETKSEDNKSKQNFSNRSYKDLLAEAIKQFKAGENTKAAEKFEYLEKKGHKPSTSNFYLGEIAYKQKSYSSAIKHYQKSIQGNDKADYMPKLLYHTAISFDKIGDTASANRFYKALKSSYPDSKEAKSAPKRN